MTAVPSVIPVSLEEGRDLIGRGLATCAMKGQARDYWPTDPFDAELRALLREEAHGEHV